MKDSGADWLGRIPSQWATTRIKTLFEIKKRIAGELGLDVLSVTQRGLKVRDVESNNGQLSMDYSKYQIVEPGDFVMNHMDLLTGYVDISIRHGVTSPDYRVFAPRSDAICPQFFLHVFQNNYRQKIFYAFGQGSSQFGRWRMPTESFNDFILPLPPLAEQMAVAAFLDHETSKINALVKEQRQLIELLKEKRRAIVSRAVTMGLNPAAKQIDSNVEWSGEVPKHWRVLPSGWTLTRLDNTCDLITGKAHEPYFDDGGPYICVTARFVSTQGESRKMCSTNLSPVKKNDILMVMSDLPNGRALARAFFVCDDAEYALNQRVCAVRVRQGNPRYFFYQLDRNEQLLRYDDGVSQTHLSNKAFTTLRIRIPPVQEQNEIVAYLDDRTSRFDRLINEAGRAISLFEERRATLISAAVTGKIDVRRPYDLERLTA